MRKVSLWDGGRSPLHSRLREVVSGGGGSSSSVFLVVVAVVVGLVLLGMI